MAGEALEPGVMAIVLLAAVLHASWNAIVKVGSDRLITMTLVIGTHGLISLPILPFVPIPAAEAWPWLMLSAGVHLIYYGTLILAYEHGDLSQVYPIARGSAPLLVALGAWLLVGEALSPTELVGILVLCGGIVSLAWHRGLGPSAGPAVGLALLTALTIGIYTVSDGIGVRNSGHALGYILWLFTVSSFPLVGFTIWRRRASLRDAIAPDLRNGVIGGMISMISYGSVIWALGQGPLAHVSALRETSVLMAALIGAGLLKEPFGPRRIAASAVVVGGAVLLNIGP